MNASLDKMHKYLDTVRIPIRLACKTNSDWPMVISLWFIHQNGLLYCATQKSAKIVGKPVPKLEPIITKIMDVVWIDDLVEYEKGKHNVTISLYNYTSSRKKFNLYAVVPEGSIDGKSISLKPARIRKSGKIRWELKAIPSTEKMDITFRLKGLDKDDFDEAEIYVSGINPVQVIGAEPLPGDWDLDEEIREPSSYGGYSERA